MSWCEHTAPTSPASCFLTICGESFVTPSASPAGPSLGDSAVLVVGRGLQLSAGRCRAAASREHPWRASLERAGLMPVRLTKVPWCSGRLASRRAQGRMEGDHSWSAESTVVARSWRGKSVAFTGAHPTCFVWIAGVVWLSERAC